MATELLPTERDVVRLRLGLDDGVPQTAKEVADIFGGRFTQAGKFRKTRPLVDIFSILLLSRVADFLVSPVVLQLSEAWSERRSTSFVLLSGFIRSN